MGHNLQAWDSVIDIPDEDFHDANDIVHEDEVEPPLQAEVETRKLRKREDIKNPNWFGRGGKAGGQRWP